jgi:hypothetical protein
MRRTLTSTCDPLFEEPDVAPARLNRDRPGKVLSMLRHVVLFTWSPAADAERRKAIVQALHRLRQDAPFMSALVVEEDAGLSDGNAHTVLIADFADVETYYRYAQDPVHLAVLAEHVRPWIAARSAVQYTF